MTDPLPIDEVLPQVVECVRVQGQVVLQAPPGAGKTTRVPLALLPVTEGRILMLEPRRLAARAAAERMAEQLGEAAGQTVGYRMRGAQKTSASTRIEVVTEGILTAMIQSDPELSDVGAVIFDEFHERSLNADLGLALCLEIKAALRPELALVVMSATLDAEGVAELMGDAPVVTSEGRAFPVVTHHAPRPVDRKRGLATSVAQQVEEALAQEPGSALVFLPGVGEIRAVERALSVPGDVDVQPLYAGLPFAAQRAAIAPAKPGRRKVVLATSIAETSLTIEGIRIVIDAGLSRMSQFDPGSGMAKLVTRPVSRAAADQRRGRAGRVEPGVCFRMWTEGEERALPAFTSPEIATTDLSPLALEMARWGAVELPLLTPPPTGAFAAAQDLLKMLGALDAQGRITAHGQKIAAIPAHPRLAHMLLQTPGSAPVAALVQGRDVLRGAGGSDLVLRVRGLADPKLFRREYAGAVDEAALSEALAEAKRLAKFGSSGALNVAEALARAYPDRVAARRPGAQPRYLMAGGKGAFLPSDDPLAGQPFLAIADLDGDATEAKIRRAAPLSESEVRALFTTEITETEVCRWSKRNRRVEARRQERLGALVLSDQLWRDAPDDAIAKAAAEGVRELGLAALGWSKAARRLQARVMFLQPQAEALPDFSDTGLFETLDDWLVPYLGKVRSAEDLRAFDPLPALQARLDWAAQQFLDQHAPAQFKAPTGRQVPVFYGADGPEIEIRLQELFGLTTHPTLGPARMPLRITLLSPAGRPLQTTSDLPGFWQSSYLDVRKDMRGRYPKHPWPEDPTTAQPTVRTKPRSGQ
ncbi:MAG: ATP-dependent helicase HrpB [Pseudomonadota bacterium]